MNAWSNLIDRLVKAGLILSALLLMSLVGLILTEIFLRYFFDSSTLIADEYSGYLYLASIFLGLGYTFSQDGHIRINILTMRLNERKRNIIDVVASVIALLALLFILYRSLLFVYESYELEMVSETVSETPLYLTQMAMPLGIIIFILAVIAFIAKKVQS